MKKLLDLFPSDLQKAIKSRDMAKFMGIVEKMPVEEAKALVEAFEPVAAKLGLVLEPPKGPDTEKVLRDFEPLLQAITAIAKGKGDDNRKAQIEEGLSRLEKKGWHLSDAVRRIWNGERDPDALASDLDIDSACLVQRILELIDGKQEP